jgi:hypothetical protein
MTRARRGLRESRRAEFLFIAQEQTQTVATETLFNRAVNENEYELKRLY